MDMFSLNHAGPGPRSNDKFRRLIEPPVIWSSVKHIMSIASIIFMRSASISGAVLRYSCML